MASTSGGYRRSHICAARRFGRAGADSRCHGRVGRAQGVWRDRHSMAGRTRRARGIAAPRQWSRNGRILAGIGGGPCVDGSFAQPQVRKTLKPAKLSKKVLARDGARLRSVVFFERGGLVEPVDHHTQASGNPVKFRDGCATVTGDKLPQPLVRTRNREGGSEVRSPKSGYRPECARHGCA